MQSLSCAIATKHGRVTLRNRELTMRRGADVQRETLDDDDVVRALEEHFGIVVPRGATFAFVRDEREAAR